MSIVSLRTRVDDLPGVGPATRQRLNRLGIRTALDLLLHFPLRHEDLRRITNIADLHTGVTSVVRGRLVLLTTRRGYRRRRMSITEGIVEDASGSVRVVWFNQPYIATSYAKGQEVFLIGRLVEGAYGTQFQSPVIERVDVPAASAGTLLPVYAATEGLTQRQFRTLIRPLMPLSHRLQEWLPDDVLRSERLLPLPMAVQRIHFSSTPAMLRSASERLKFGELFLFSITILEEERSRHRRSAESVPLQTAETRQFIRSLPFRLTDGQRRAAWEILQDLAKPAPMNRLLEGDVGSGKTVIAAVALHAVAMHGGQSVILAPTELLAQQHYRTLERTLESRQVRIGLLTGSLSATVRDGTVTKRRLRQLILDGEVDCIVGTHALLEKTVQFPRLCLVVIDEQHRFGVSQRHALQSRNDALQPHLLSMTATPIPRTLALTLFGDLKLSQLRELPPGRRPITTAVVGSDEDRVMWEDVRQRVAAGQQAFVVCPIIEESDTLGVSSAVAEFTRLKSGELAGVSVGLLHGRLPAKEKRDTLERFSSRSLSVLVATPVVEVGVDVPNATAMVIEGAERFGMAQLHQLRGRIGRGTVPSACYLMTDTDIPETIDRLRRVAASTDGFALAEEDLKQRGPGDLSGLRQWGLPEFRIASLGDIALMRRAHDAADRLLNRDPNLRRAPGVRRKVTAFSRTIHPE